MNISKIEADDCPNKVLIHGDDETEGAFYLWGNKYYKEYVRRGTHGGKPVYVNTVWNHRKIWYDGAVRKWIVGEVNNSNNIIKRVAIGREDVDCPDYTANWFYWSEE